ncbi:MAG: ketoacyl-ACP synthase III [Gammaproteobacteria bacterium]|nr:ketoacyl-ACP synthase III [Gammaproteobacteria bacterium]
MEINGHTEILGIGGYVPSQIVKSSDLLDEIGAELRFGIKNNFISEVIGIEERRVAEEKQKPSDLAILAAERALLESGVTAAEIDLVIFCGIDRDWQEPATAHRVQQVIGANNATCFDVTNACHGFMNGVSIADAMIAIGSANHALVCTGEKSSEMMYDTLDLLATSNDRDDMKRWIGGLTVGDAGGAMILGKSHKQNGFRKFNFSSNGQHADLCYYGYDKAGDIEGQMMMSSISREMIAFHQSMINSTYQGLIWSPKEVDHLICHQVGQRPHRKMASIADVPVSRAPITYRNLGNITSATIPVNLYFNRPEKGDKVLILGAGSGLSVSQTGMVF